MEVSGQLHIPVGLPAGEWRRYSLDIRLDGPQERSGSRGEEKNFLLPGNCARADRNVLTAVKWVLRKQKCGWEGGLDPSGELLCRRQWSLMFHKTGEYLTRTATVLLTYLLTYLLRAVQSFLTS